MNGLAVAPHRRPVLVTVLVGTMAASSFQLYALAVLASELIDEFELSRARVALLGAANTAVAASLSPAIGGVVDRIGARRSVLIVAIGGGVGLLLMAAAQTYLMLVVASLFSGLFQGGGNPATNKLISVRTDPGTRGIITGVKQSGVTLSLFLCGVTLPGIAVLAGWRTGVVAYAILSFALAAISWKWLGPDPGGVPPKRDGSAPKERLDTWVYRIAVFGFLLGVVTGGILRFIALFAEEALGYSATIAGLAAALVGVSGMAARVAWGRIAEGRMGTRTALAIQAALATITCLLLALAESIGRWVIWPIAVLTAVSAIAWNAVGMLAIIQGVPSRLAGRASGVVLVRVLGRNHRGQSRCRLGRGSHG